MFEFFNNFVYLFGCYGLWIFFVYYFQWGGGCDDCIVEFVVFGLFIVYNNMCGVEVVKVGVV